MCEGKSPKVSYSRQFIVIVTCRGRWVLTPNLLWILSLKTPHTTRRNEKFYYWHVWDLRGKQDKQVWNGLRSRERRQAWFWIVISMWGWVRLPRHRQGLAGFKSPSGAKGGNIGPSCHLTQIWRTGGEETLSFKICQRSNIKTIESNSCIYFQNL